MCYVIITGGSLFWFIISLIADMLILSAIVTAKWLIGPNYDSYKVTESNFTVVRYPSVGIFMRCKNMYDKYHCGAFDIDGFATDNYVYPGLWKASMFFISLGFTILTITVFLTLVTCCRQSLFGKSIHNITGSVQVFSGICVGAAVFLHSFGWGADRVKNLCGPEAEAFYPDQCSIGWSFYCALGGMLLCFICAGCSLKAESGNMKSSVKRRVEGGERLVCVP